MSLLEAKNLTMRFGGLTSVSDFNLTLEKGEIVGLIDQTELGKALFSICFADFISRPKERSSLKGGTSQA